MLSCFVYMINFLRIIIPAVSLLGTAPTFFILWFLLRLITLICFSRRIYRRYDDYLYSLYQRFILFFFENWVNVKIYFHGDYIEIISKKENVLYISNHRSAVDWIIANMLAVRQGSIGHIRYVLKSVLKWIPLYGFYFQEHGCIYVHRTDKKDLDRLEKGISQIKYNGLPVWLVIFPEGTRYNSIEKTQVIERSRLFAQQKGVLPFDNLLYPRTGAVIAVINALKDKLNAVYDITVIYSNNNQQIRLASPSMIEYLEGQIQELHIHIKRIPINLIPSETNEQISNWIYQRFVIKDKLLNHCFESNNDYINTQLNLNITMYPCIFFILTTFLLLITPLGRSLYWKIWLFATPICLLWMHLFPTKKVN